MRTTQNGRPCRCNPERNLSCARPQLARPVQILPADYDFFAYCEDADLNGRAQWRNWRCWYDPRAVAYHRRGQATAYPLAIQRHAGSVHRHQVEGVDHRVRRLLEEMVADVFPVRRDIARQPSERKRAGKVADGKIIRTVNN